MPEGKQIQVSAGEYPELEGLEDGAKVTLDVMATFNASDDGGGTLTFDNVEISTEGAADRQLKQMTKQDSIGSSSGKMDTPEDM